jgi:hypothetical protein
MGGEIELHTPEYWEARADEVRTKAADLHDPDARKSLLVIATIYEHMARRAALRERKQPLQ